jgi:hypothetical protein
LLRTLDVDNPVAGEEFLGFREYTIGNGLPVTSRANDLGLIGKGQSFCGDENAGSLEFLTERLHESQLRLKVLLGPLGEPIELGLSSCSRSKSAFLDMTGQEIFFPAVTQGTRRR